MSNRLLLVTALATSMALAGCDSLLYSNTLAPVFSKTQQQTPPPPLNTPHSGTTEIGSIEKPQGNTGVVVQSAQNNPYGNQPVPQRPSDMSNMPQNNQTVEASATLGQSADTTVTKASDNAQNTVTTATNNSDNSPRVREASEVLNTQGTVAGKAPMVERPKATVSQQAAAQAAKQKEQAKQAAANQAQAAVKESADTSKANTTAAAATAPSRPATQQSATKALLQEARTAVGAGNYDKAASALERAHRIEPGNAKILYDIAQIRYAQGKYRQAESFASKAANYSSSAGLSKKIWTLLGHSRKALGNNTGAEAAAKKAANF